MAAVRCVRALRRHGSTESILLVGDEAHLPYNRPPLSKEVLGADVDIDLLLAESPAWYERRGIEVRTGTRAASIDRDRRTVELENGERLRFGRVLLATGAAPRLPPIPGVERGFLLRTFDDAVRLRTAVRPGVRVVIIGGGFIGVETAAALAGRGAEVTVVELGGALWGGALGSDLSAWAASALEGHGVSIRFGVVVTGIDAESVSIGDERLGADVAVLCVGVLPRDELAREAGLPCDNGIVTDTRYATADEEIFAAGDVARVDGRRIEHWHAAREGGERAALAMLGRDLPAARAPWIYSDFGDRHLDVVGAALGDERIELLAVEERRPSAVAWVDTDGRVTQLAVTGGFADIDVVRPLISSRPTVAELERAILGADQGTAAASANGPGTPAVPG